ncbi:hypothetical protein OG939_36010 [Streptomyces sp. NBC_01685]|nr:hypothetical protein [Streptomyces sp. NBC_01685]
MSLESFPTRVFHPAMATTQSTRTTPADGFFHPLDAEEGFT